MKNTQTSKPKTSKKNLLQWAGVLGFMALSTVFVFKNSMDLQVSVIPTKQAAPFDGTALPVQKVPAWTSLSSAQWKLSYEQIPADKLIDTPVYDAAQLKTPTEQLGWKSATDLAIRNAKITFSTPYMGNYKLDGVEGAGSHLAVDIKVPNNTPVYAIGNGVVVKVSNQSSGFGVHVVVKHENFPSYADPNVKTTYYSSYSHMGKAIVAEGDIVTKGQQVGLSGETGTATTPHVHFQIDTTQAPWHPYWPFTYQEATAAGLDFTSAINAGLGREKGLVSTINPVMYVQKYKSGSVSATSSSSSSSTSSSSSSSSTSSNTSTQPANVQSTPQVNGNSSSSTSTSGSSSTANTSAPGSEIPGSENSGTSTSTPDNSTTTPETPSTTDTTTSTETVTVEQPAKPAVGFEFYSSPSFEVGAEESVTLKAIDEDKNTVKAYRPDQGVQIRIENGSATLNRQFYYPEDFINGQLNFKFTSNGDQGLVFKASDGKLTGSSEVLTSIKHLTFKDVEREGDFVNALNFLKKYNVVQGYPDGTFKPKNVVSRVEALKFILIGTRIALVNSGTFTFKDTSAKEWYTPYIRAAVAERVAGGYADGTFKPGQTVNRAEFLKMLLAAMKVELPTVTQDVFADVPKDAWFAPYVQYAKDKKLIAQTEGNFKPSEGMSRQEVAQLIYRLVVIRLTNAESYSDSLVVSGTAADSYFK